MCVSKKERRGVKGGKLEATKAGGDREDKRNTVEGGTLGERTVEKDRTGREGRGGRIKPKEVWVKIP